MIAVVVALLLLAPAMAPAAAAPDPDTAQARSRLALAREGVFHLVLDLEQGELRLMLGGVTLRTFPYSSAETATPRHLFRPAPTLTGWEDQVWADGTLDPERERERVEIVPQPGNSQAAELPPPPPPPAAYRIRFTGGLDLEIVGEGTPAPTAGLKERLHLLTGPGTPRLRVRLVLTREDASALYGCLPPLVRLAVRGRPAA